MLAMCRLQDDGELTHHIPLEKASGTGQAAWYLLKEKFFLKQKQAISKRGCFYSLAGSSCVGKPRKPHLKGCTWTK